MGAPHQLGGGAALTPPPARPPEPPTVRISEVAGISLDRHLLFWVAALVTVALVLWLLGEVLLPFVAAMALAYVLDPLTTRLERAGIYRPLAALATISLVVLAFIVLILLIAPIVVSQFAALIEHIPGYIRRVQALIADPSRPWLQRFLGEGISSSDKSSSDLVAQGMGWFTTFLGSPLGRGTCCRFDLLAARHHADRGVLSAQRLASSGRHGRSLDTLAASRHGPRPGARYQQGNCRICPRAIAGMPAARFFLCHRADAGGPQFRSAYRCDLRTDHVLPYVGSMTGLVLALAVAVAQFWPDWTWILVVLAIFLTGQFLEGNVLTPKLIGDSAGLHPVWLMFALFAFGYLFGFVGLLLAVPLAAAIGVLARFALRRYLESPLYTGAEPG
jgi:predicted PurR-regulated permease PerM